MNNQGLLHNRKIIYAHNKILTTADKLSEYILLANKLKILFIFSQPTYINIYPNYIKGNKIGKYADYIVRKLRNGIEIENAKTEDKIILHFDYNSKLKLEYISGSFSATLYLNKEQKNKLLKMGISEIFDFVKSFSADQLNL